MFSIRTAGPFYVFTSLYAIDSKSDSYRSSDDSSEDIITFVIFFPYRTVFFLSYGGCYWPSF